MILNLPRLQMFMALEVKRKMRLCPFGLHHEVLAIQLKKRGLRYSTTLLSEVLSSGLSLMMVLALYIKISCCFGYIFYFRSTIVCCARRRRERGLT